MYRFEEGNGKKAYFMPLWGNAEIEVKIVRIIYQNDEVISMQAIDCDGYEIVGTIDRFHY